MAPVFFDVADRSEARLHPGRTWGIRADESAVTGCLPFASWIVFSRMAAESASRAAGAKASHRADTVRLCPSGPRIGAELLYRCSSSSIVPCRPMPGDMAADDRHRSIMASEGESWPRDAITSANCAAAAA